MATEKQPYQFLPPLRDTEYQALKADIAKRGVLVPVEIDIDGNILDGHNRAAIAAELGIGFDKVVRVFETETAKREHVLKLNLLRRHLGPIAWAEAFRQLCEERGVRVGVQGRQEEKSCTVQHLAAELGVDRTTAYRRLALAEELANAPDLAAKVDAGDMEAKQALRVSRERKARQTLQDQPIIALPATIDLRLGDFREVLCDIPNTSIDLIFTDPPYPQEYLPLWLDLAKLAARVLKPGALLVAYSGQYHLPTVLRFLAEHLEYVWLGALLTPGAHNQVHTRHIRSGVKPLLFFARPPYKPGPWFEDWSKSEARDKELHPWQQTVGPARYYLERLTAPGAVVLDPFLGSGTTALAALELGRSFLGSEIDPTALATTRKRIHDATSQN